MFLVIRTLALVFYILGLVDWHRNFQSAVLELLVANFILTLSSDHRPRK